MQDITNALKMCASDEVIEYGKVFMTVCSREGDNTSFMIIKIDDIKYILARLYWNEKVVIVGEFRIDKTATVKLMLELLSNIARPADVIMELIDADVCDYILTQLDKLYNTVRDSISFTIMELDYDLTQGLQAAIQHRRISFTIMELDYDQNVSQ